MASSMAITQAAFDKIGSSDLLTKTLSNNPKFSKIIKNTKLASDKI